MKYCSAIILFLLAASSCDKIDQPIPDPTSGVDTTGQQNQFNDTTYASTASNAFRSIVVEDYTGQSCGNCPIASDIAGDLIDLYGDTVIVVAVHTGNFAEPYSSGDKYRSDYRTEAGEFYNDKFSVDAFGYPNGMINRTKLPTEIVISPLSWKSKINELITDPDYVNPELQIDLQNIYNSNSNSNTVTIDIKRLTPSSAQRNVVFWLLESGVIDWQKDYRLPTPQQDVANYEHKHMLRAAFPNPEGEPVAFNNNSYQKTFSFLIDEDWIHEKMLVAVVYDSQSNEIIQAAEVHVGNP